MSLYVPTGTPPIVANAVARIERRLPQPGEVLVRQGQRVEPEDVVARAFLPGVPQIINVARALMITPRQVERAMRRERGNTVRQGEVLAQAGRLIRQTCYVPVNGQIAAVDPETGYVTIIPDRQQFDLLANVRGYVMEVLPYEGVRLETPAAQVYGAFGFGVERSGVLRLIVTDPSEAIEPEMIDARSAYAILIGGSGITAAALRRAVQEQVRGIIVGGIDEQELRVFLHQTSLDYWRTGVGNWHILAPQNISAPPLTLLVTEGFGTRPMSARLFDLLAEHDRQEALIEGLTRLRRPQTRPRVVIPLSARGASALTEAPRPVLRPNAQVRLLDSTHLGQIGLVRRVSSGPRRLGSGVRAPAVEVTLDDGETLMVSRAAVEVLS